MQMPIPNNKGLRRNLINTVHSVDATRDRRLLTSLSGPCLSCMAITFSASSLGRPDISTESIDIPVELRCISMDQVDGKKIGNGERRKITMRCALRNYISFGDPAADFLGLQAIAIGRRDVVYE